MAAEICTEQLYTYLQDITSCILINVSRNGMQHFKNVNLTTMNPIYFQYYPLTTEGI